MPKDKRTLCNVRNAKPALAPPGGRARLDALVSLAAILLLGCQAPGPAPAPAEIETRRAALAVPGFADLHFHMVAEEAFGGAWMHGRHDGPLADCDGGFPPSDHARVRQDVSELLSACPQSAAIGLPSDGLLGALFTVGGTGGSEMIGKIRGTEGDTGLHLGRAKFPAGWPRWDTIAHQQGHRDWLKQAHERGLNLVVVPAVTFDWLCKITPPQNRARPGCDEMADVDAQLALMHELAKKNADWLEIALDPGHARRIIGEGKLAVVLAIETSHLFGRDVDARNLRARLDHYHGLGVRSLQPAHEVDNAFSGVATHQPIMQVAQFTETCHVDTDCPGGLTTNGVTLGFDVDGSCKNTKGLSPLGATLVNAMMDKGMLVDVAHLSERSIRDVHELAVARQHYPLYVSHGHFRDIMAPSVADHEKSTPTWVVEMIRKTGGMFGLRTAHEETRTYLKGTVANSCHGSSRSFAQAYQFGALGLKVPMAFGADLNGFVAQTRPRFGEHGACSAAPAAEAACQVQAQRQLGPGRLGTEFDEKGLAHIGLLPDLIADLKQLGVDTSGLERSAETFIGMWERAQGPRSGEADPAADLDPSGVGTVGRTCACEADADCAPGGFCNQDLPLTARDNRCTSKKSEHQGCNRAAQCASGHCGGLVAGAGWCYAPASKGVGQGCRVDGECVTGRCGDVAWTCLCRSDADCGDGRFCGWGANDGKCVDKRGSGAACTKDRECASGDCRLRITGPRCR